MNPEERRFCPFHNIKADPDKPQREFASLPSSSESRLEALRHFIGQEGFICRIATFHEKAGMLSYLPLAKEPDGTGFLQQLKEPIGLFVKKGTGALILQFPEEPRDYTELKKMKENICGQVMAAIFMNGAWHKKDLLLGAATALNRTRLRKFSERSDSPIAIPREYFISCFTEHLSHQVAMPGFDFEKTLVNFGSIVAKAIPNAAPMIGERQIQQIVMSRLYHQSTVPVCPVSREYHIEHGRYSPSTCLVISYVDEVNQAREKPAGIETTRRTAGSTLVYNQHAPESQKYLPADILAQAFGFASQTAPLQELMENYHKVLDECLKLGAANEELNQLLALLPPEMREIVVAAGLDRDPDALSDYLGAMLSDLKLLLRSELRS